MYHDIEPMYLRKCIHFKLTTPAGIVSDPSNVVFDRLIVLNEKLVQLLILLYIVGALRSILYMALFATRQLVAQCAEHAISICAHFFDFQAISLQLLLELDHVLFIPG